MDDALIAFQRKTLSIKLPMRAMTMNDSGQQTRTVRNEFRQTKNESITRSRLRSYIQRSDCWRLRTALSCPRKRLTRLPLFSAWQHRICILLTMSLTPVPDRAYYQKNLSNLIIVDTPLRQPTTVTCDDVKCRSLLDNLATRLSRRELHTHFV